MLIDSERRDILRPHLLARGDSGGRAAPPSSHATRTHTGASARGAGYITWHEDHVVTIPSSVALLGQGAPAQGAAAHPSDARGFAT